MMGGVLLFLAFEAFVVAPSRNFTTFLDAFAFRNEAIRHGRVVELSVEARVTNK